MSMMSNLLNKVVSFSDKTEYVKHEAHYDVPVTDAFQVCMDYAEFIKVMLRRQKNPPNPKWIEGGPGEVGGTVEYLLERQGSTNTIVERVVRLEFDPEQGGILEWEQLRSDPPLPLKEYGCRWQMKPMVAEETGKPITHLIWTRHFKEPKVAGISLAGVLKNSFRETAGPIMNFVFRQYYTSQFPPADRRLPKKGERVVIIGAGPSGLHMAHLLKNEVGIEEITILERTDRYGGKTLTVESEINFKKYGVVHELGTCYLSPAYFAVRTYMKELKQALKSKFGEAPEGFADEVGPIHYSVHRPGHSDLTLNEWITSNLQLQPTFNPLALFRILFPWQDTQAELLAAKIKYNKLHEEIFGPYDYTMPPRLSKEKLQQIDMSFGQFLSHNGMSVLMPILAYGQTAQGYGALDQIPAFWAMCWITPQLMDGYFRPDAPDIRTSKSQRAFYGMVEHFFDLSKAEPKKAMFKIGWESMWKATVEVNELQIEYNTTVEKITRAEGGDGPVIVKSYQTDDDGEIVAQEREFDYLVVAAPLWGRTYQDSVAPMTQICETEMEKMPTDDDQVVPLNLTEAERAVLCHPEMMANSQFRTLLYQLNQPQPYLYSHLEIIADKLLGPDTGKGDVFASRDSYLALHPKYCTWEGHQDDPLRDHPREQMAYQWVSNGKDAPLELFNDKFDEWMNGKYGFDSKKNVEAEGDTENQPYYKMLKHQHWTYFRRFNRDGLRQHKLWQVLDLQGRNKTLFVHASAFFESVLDIINYNNMLVDGLTGKLNELSQPKSDVKPGYEESLHWKLGYNKITKTALIGLDIVLGTVWTALYIPLRPLLTPLVRWQRLGLQKAFKTENPGPWYKFDMSHFLKVSPSIICFIEDTEDPVVRDSKKYLADHHPEIPQVDKALMWNFSDYRTAIRVWMDHGITPDFLNFISDKMADRIRWFRLTFPIAYNYFASWGFCISFNLLTGYSVRIEDERGGGCYVPRCEMLAVARKEYGEELGSRICTHVCKIFTEEAMRRKGLDCTLEPNQAEGSCMIRGVPPRIPAYSDHAVLYGMQVTPEEDSETIRRKVWEPIELI